MLDFSGTCTQLNHRDSVKWLGVIVERILTCLRHESRTFTKSIWTSTPYRHILSQSAFPCVLTHWLYSIPVDFPACCQSLKLTFRPIKFSSSCSFMYRYILIEFLIVQHNKLYQKFSAWILTDSFHSAQGVLGKSTSCSTTRSFHNHVHARIPASSFATVLHGTRYSSNSEIVIFQLTDSLKSNIIITPYHVFVV